MNPYATENGNVGTYTINVTPTGDQVRASSEIGRGRTTRACVCVFVCLFVHASTKWGRRGHRSVPDGVTSTRRVCAAPLHPFRYNDNHKYK